MHKIIFAALAASALLGSARAETVVEFTARTPCLFEYRIWLFTFRHGDVFPIPEGFTKEQCDAAIVANEQIPALMRAEVEADAKAQLAANADQLAAQIDASRQEQERRRKLVAGARRMTADQLMAFAVKNAGKFATELQGLPAMFIVRVPASAGDFFGATYDTDTGAMKVLRPMLMSVDRWLFQRCNTVGSYMGSNGFGARATFYRQNCTRLEIREATLESLGFDPIELSIAMSPTQYRSIKATGAPMDILLTIGTAKNTPVAEVDSFVGSATVSSPFERHFQVWRINGHFEKTEVLDPGTLKPLISF